MPDPVFQTNPTITHYMFWVPAHSLVDGLSYGPNARRPNIRKHVYRKLDESLMNVDCTENTFHLKNIGISINAHSVNRIADDRYEVDLHDSEHLRCAQWRPHARSNSSADQGGEHSSQSVRQDRSANRHPQ